jgi:hypothetical protein
MPQSSQPKIVNILIIGGSPARLRAASTLSTFTRQLQTVVLFDSGGYRNIDAAYLHMVLIWDYRNLRAFRTVAQSEIEEIYDQLVIFENKDSGRKKKTPKYRV